MYATSPSRSENYFYQSWTLFLTDWASNESALDKNKLNICPGPLYDVFAPAWYVTLGYSFLIWEERWDLGHRSGNKIYFAFCWHCALFLGILCVNTQYCRWSSRFRLWLRCWLQYDLQTWKTKTLHHHRGSYPWVQPWFSLLYPCECGCTCRVRTRGCTPYYWHWYLYNTSPIQPFRLPKRCLGCYRQYSPRSDHSHYRTCHCWR